MWDCEGTRPVLQLDLRVRMFLDSSSGRGLGREIRARCPLIARLLIMHLPAPKRGGDASRIPSISFLPFSKNLLATGFGHLAEGVGDRQDIVRHRPLLRFDEAMVFPVVIDVHVDKAAGFA